jgi:SAM-dependent methyltransferase
MADPSERIIGLYEDTAAAFDEQRIRDLFERAWMDRFAGGLSPGASILDIGCGMGEPIAQHFIGQGFHVTGVDSSPALIALCRERFPDQTWLVGDMRDLTLGRRFDGLIVWHSMFHLTPEDQRAMFPRLGAHAAPGAALMFTSGLGEGDAIGSWQGEPLYHGSLSPLEYRALLAAEGFEVLRYVECDPSCGGAMVWLARKTTD